MKKYILFFAAFAMSYGVVAMPGPERRAECAARTGKYVGQMTGDERIGQLMMDSPPLPMLAIDGYHWRNEALHGVACAGLAIVFPQAIGLAATFDAALEKRIGDVVSSEARAKYNLFSSKGRRGAHQGLTLWGPSVNLFRDPRWGRGQETFGEDPFLAGTMGSAYVKGLQGDDPKFLKTAACVRKFAVHSGPENQRHGFDAKVSTRDLAEYYLPAFRQLVMKGRVESVMCACSSLNGVPCTANRWLLTDLLRGEWGFSGYVVSDVGGVHDVVSGHKFAKDPVEASKVAIAAGLDLCAGTEYAALHDALADGRLSAGQLVLPLTRLYTTRVLLGMFDLPGATPWSGLGANDIATDAHRPFASRLRTRSRPRLRSSPASGRLRTATGRRMRCPNRSLTCSNATRTPGIRWWRSSSRGVPPILCRLSRRVTPCCWRGIRANRAVSRSRGRFSDGRIPPGDFTVSVGGGQPGFVDCKSAQVCFVKVEDDD